MLKRVVLITSLALMTAAAALAASVAGTAGTVVAVDRSHVQLTLDGESASWVRKGAVVSIQGTRGRIAHVAGDTLDVVTTKAAKVKPGDTVQVAPAPKSASGC